MSAEKKLEETAAQPNIIEKFGRERLEEIQETIANATGLAFVTVDYTGKPVTETTSFSCFCNRLRYGEGNCELCMKSDAFGALQAAISRKPYIYYCPYGLLEVAIPLEENGAFLGGFIGGQVRCNDAPADIVHLSSLFKSKESEDYAIKYKEEKDENRKYSFSHFTDVVNLIHLILKQLNEQQSMGTSEASQLEIQQLQDEKIELKSRIDELERKEAKFMLSQNQYLIGNMISSVAGMALIEGAEGTNELLLQMADYIRDSSKFMNDQWTLDEELSLVELYIKLACLKYGERFRYSMEVHKEIRTRRIPTFSILTYVEAAVYFGVALAKEEVELEIRITSDDEDCIVEIRENGPGYSDEELRELFKGLRHEHEGHYINKAVALYKKRMVKEYGEKYRPQITVDNGKGRCFHLRIPEV
ncbi:MAG: PocR ligand-binding domain-containing protein [Lachnospiraceae bacterium]|nr:PocR ligand-binding domain-containing protein [Lachnospiraceae bacterium]